MKKQLLSGMVLAVMIAIFLIGCSIEYKDAKTTENGEFGNGYFTTISKWGDSSYGDYRIVYANDSKVKYFVNTSSYRTGITPLYNADGTLQVYEESEDW